MSLRNTKKSHSVPCHPARPDLNTGRQVQTKVMANYQNIKLKQGILGILFNWNKELCVEVYEMYDENCLAISTEQISRKRLVCLSTHLQSLCWDLLNWNYTAQNEAVVTLWAVLDAS